MGMIGNAPVAGTIGTANIQDGGVTTADLAAGAVTPAKLSTGAPVWDTSGNVGMGRTPNYKVDAYASGTGSPAVASSNDNIVTVVQSVGASQGNVGTLTSHPLVLIAGNTERGRFNVSTGAFELAQGQIKFPATQNPSSDANTLDDYEEGTWTPSPICSYGSITYSSVSTSGTYVKIGKTVYCWFKASFTASSNAGNTGLSGLPFAINATGLGGGLQMAGTAREDGSSGNLYQVEGFTTGNSYFQVLRKYDNGSIVSGGNSFGGAFMYQTS